MNRVLKTLLVFGAFAIAPLMAVAQATWPTKPVHVIVGYGAGGPADIIMRALATKLSATWGQPVLVENKPGANEIVAAVELTKRDPDGHTLILGTDALYSLNRLVRVKPGYDAVKDLAPIGRVGQSPLGLFVRPDFPAQDLKGFIAYAKAYPGRLTYASTGNGGITHLAMSWMSKLYGLDMVQAPYNAVPTLMQDLSQGRIDMTMLATGPLMPFVTSGRLRLLAVAGPTRVAIAPDAPTFAEAGFPEFHSIFYLGLAAPANTPLAILNKISADTAAAVKSADIIKQFNVVGFQPVSETPAQFAAFLVKDRAAAADRVKAANVKLD